MQWSPSADLGSLAGQPVRLRFHLANARLCAFWVSPEDSGASHGYVAAGGPGFTEARDTIGRARMRRPGKSRRSSWEPLYGGYVVRSALVCSSLLLMSAVGCSGLPFVPTEAITAATAGRLSPVYSQLHAGYALERTITPDLPCALGRVQIEGRRHRMYIHRRTWTGLAQGLPTGVYEFDLLSGGIIRRTRFPSRPDMTGEQWYATESCVFNLRHRAALFDTGFGGTGAVVLLDLEQDRPQLIEHHSLEPGDEFSVDVAPHPLVDNRRLLLVREQMSTRPYGPSHLLYVDIERRAIVAEYAVARLGRELSFTGGIGDFVLAHRREEPMQPAELIVLEPREGELRLRNRLRLDDGFEPTGTPLTRGWSSPTEAIDRVRHWWITAERLDRRNRICVYAVPSLERVAQIPTAADELSICPATGVLSVIPADEPRSLVLYQLPEAVEIARLRLPRHDYLGAWKIVQDDDGLYVGVSGCQWVHLWAVRDGGL